MDPFFDEAREQSQVKSAIVDKYFSAWTTVMIPHVKGRGEKLVYIDLFSGPGYYQANGAKSTPILVLERALQSPELCERLVTIFNDVDPDHAQCLDKAIQMLPGIDSLKHRPQVACEAVGPELVERLQAVRLAPTLLFVDPWGYKGVSRSLLGSVLKDWGCDCILFFNYNRINMAINNLYVLSHMEAMFGTSRVADLRVQLTDLSPDQRELTIIDEIVSALQEIGGAYVLPFCFKNEHGTRTSHHLIFVSKNALGYKIMKEIMARESSASPQGVASFMYNRADSRHPLLFELARPLDDLEGMLLTEFAGQRLRMVEVYERHNVGRPFISRNYKDVLLKLEAKGCITTNPPAAKRPKRNGKVTFADGVLVEFPQR